MTQINRSDAWSIDDLELELRMLPGVCAAGFDEHDDMLLVQLHVAEKSDRADRTERIDQPVPVSASRIAARHSDRPVAVEVIRWRAGLPIAPVAPAPAPAMERVTPNPPATGVEESAETNRARLLAVLAFPDTDELEVHLVFDGKRTIGRAPARHGVDGAVEATIEAVRELGIGISARKVWARVVDDAGDDEQVVVAVALDGVDDRPGQHLGLAGGASAIDAASRATLDALNRRFSRR